MEALKQAFLEDPVYVYIFCAFAELVLAGWWYERRTRRAALAMLAPPALAVLAFAIATLVATDREQIIHATHRIARDLENNSLQAAEHYLDPNYTGLGGNKAGALEAGKAALARGEIEKIRFTSMTVEVTGDRARMHVATIVELAGGKAALVWEVLWAKGPKGWRLLQVPEPQQKIELLGP
ncbi:MAG: hypothetical protein WC869_09055 [Phycisphaerae bacterium]